MVETFLLFRFAFVSLFFLMRRVQLFVIGVFRAIEFAAAVLAATGLCDGRPGRARRRRRWCGRILLLFFQFQFPLEHFGFQERRLDLGLA